MNFYHWVYFGMVWGVEQCNQFTTQYLRMMKKNQLFMHMLQSMTRQHISGWSWFWGQQSQPVGSYGAMALH